ncbi:PucR family transcriptional regulator [Lachnospiraceae bacterium WCA-9-b2]|uniref:PucR family transcriptional regulator n=1 Tax=Sporofaciens musculi TaxID=2681861 RepID=A0A7X3SLK5_9FIRM|nr:helix-turn-helix domain-containing protein [Sporofaciens musculi]MXP78759.1 PucR family transcriptional regulator [Sporofaciens musculi]
MAVALKELYAAISPQYHVKLHTESCFDKMIAWTHVVEDIEFISSLHGEELVFFSGLNCTSEDWLKRYITELDRHHVGGLIMSFRGEETFSKEIVGFCNEIRFPIFSASWTTPYMDIMRLFAEILLKNEQRETNLIAAFKNAIYYPENEGSYLSHFERNGFLRDMEYIVVILSCHTYDEETGNEQLNKIEKSLRFILENVIAYEENRRLIILAAGYSLHKIQEEFQRLCGKDTNVYAGIGTVAGRSRDIHRSHENAYTAYRLTKTGIPRNLLSYDELGIYKILADVKEEEIYPEFVSETVGELMKYDREKHTDYMNILEVYFENDCSAVHTAQTLYCHKNTLAYKLDKIKRILGYDILKNENRVKIMVAIYILRLGTGYF